MWNQQVKGGAAQSGLPQVAGTTHVPSGGSARVTVEVSAAPSLDQVIHHIDDLNLQRFLGVAASFGQDRFGYVVTPNVDHLIRCHEDVSYHSIYSLADYVLLDSRFAAYLLRITRGLRLPVCTGSDLFPELLKALVKPSDNLVMIGGTNRQAAHLAKTYGLERLQHFNPPMGFINDPVAVERCVEFIESVSPFRFCFLVVGSPQQERLAHLLKLRGRARGLALCLGASLNFATGNERRAPLWMRHLALEWLYRLTQDPRRLAKRYFLRGPRFFGHLRKAQFLLRGPSA